MAFQTSAARNASSNTIEDASRQAESGLANADSARGSRRKWDAMHISIHDIAVDGYECGKCISPGRQAVREQAALRKFDLLVLGRCGRARLLPPPQQQRLLGPQDLIKNHCDDRGQGQ